MSNKLKWDIGEKEVIEKTSCPNCKKELMLLPPNYPLFDLQCTWCSFRAQVKSFNKKPSSIFLGAGREIMEKVLKSWYMIPPLFTNFKRHEKGTLKEEIRFYPFIPKTNLQPYKLSETARRANYKMFRYINMDEVPFFVVHKI